MTGEQPAEARETKDTMASAAKRYRVGFLAIAWMLDESADVGGTGCERLTGSRSRDQANPSPAVRRNGNRPT